MSDRLTLGFDTSAAHCAAALVRGQTVVANRVEQQTRGQAERLIPMIEELLVAHGVTWADLDAIGVGIGPGNFTGVRISVAAARGLALGLAIPAEGVGSAEAYAYDEGDATVVLPAPRGLVYLARDDRIEQHDPTDPMPAWAAPPYIGPGVDMIGGGRSGGQLAPSIARIAAGRAAIGRPRPAPLYLRPADALPSRDKAPVLLRGK